MIVYLEIMVSILLAATAVGVVMVRGLFGLTVLLSVYSGLFMVVLMLLGAVDVAFTEAVVGAGISTGFLVALLRYMRVEPELTAGPAVEVAATRRSRRILATISALLLGGVMVYAIHALPAFGDLDAPHQQHVAQQYIERTLEDTHTPNVVTAVLADYRSFDTLIETSVVLTGALACVLILSRGRRTPSP